MNLLKNSVMFLEKTKSDQTSNIGKIKFLREKRVEDKIIQKAFEKIYPDIDIKQLMQYTDSFPSRSHNPYTESTKRWGLGTLGLLSLISGAISYLGAWTSRESELESSRCAHILELEQYRLTFEFKQEKMSLERQKEKRQVEEVIKLLSSQNENIKQTINALQDSFKLLQFESNVAVRKKSAPVINDMLTNNVIPKPKWMYEKLTKIHKKTTSVGVKIEKFKPILELFKEQKLTKIFNRIKILQTQNKKENFSRTINVMLLYIKNILENPSELCYRGLNVSNKYYQKTILSPGAEEVLEAIGFEKNNGKLILPLYEKGSNESLTQLDVLNETRTRLEDIHR